DTRFTMLPALRRAISLAAYCIIISGALTLTASTRSMSSGRIMPSRPSWRIPALLTSPSSRPWRVDTCWKNGPTPSLAARSSAMQSTSGAPASRHCPATTERFASSRAVRTRLIPRPAQSSAIARPMPREAPVTTTTAFPVAMSDDGAVLGEDLACLADRAHVDHVVHVDHDAEGFFEPGHDRHVRDGIPFGDRRVAQVVGYPLGGDAKHAREHLDDAVVGGSLGHRNFLKPKRVVS